MGSQSEELAIIVRVQDLASRALKSVSRELGGLEKGSWAAGRAATRGVGTAIGNIERLAMVGAGLAVGGGAAAIKWAGDFEAGMNTINTVAMKSPAILKTAGDGIRKIARDTGASMGDLQQGEYDLVSAGIALESSQAGLTQANKLSIGALGSNAEAVDVLTTAINSYNLKAKDGTVTTATWTKVSDELAQAVADGKTTLSAIAGAYAQVAPVAAQAGIGTNEVAAALGFLTAKGNPAAETVTQMARAIIELQKPTADLTKLQDKFHKNYAAIAADKGLSVSLQQMREDAKKAGVPFIDLFGRIEAYKFALQTTGPNAAAFAAELDKVNHSAGMTNKQFDERAQGFNYQLGRLKALAKDAGITIGTALLPEATDLISKLDDLASTHQADIAAFAKDLAEGLHDAVMWAEKLDVGAIADDLRAAAGFAKGVITAFMDAPAWLQQAVVTGWGLNKLTGGAVVEVGVDLTKGLIGQFAARGASPANPMWVAQVGGPGGAGGAIGSKLGGLGGILQKLAGAAIAFGGSNLLTSGVQNGGPMGAAQGAGGAAAMIGGGALVAGPAGAIVGAVAAVGQTLIDIRDQSARMGTANTDSLAKEISGGAKLSDLKLSLAGVDQGIADINNTPLGVVLAGDALDSLHAQHDALVRQIDLQERGFTQMTGTEANTGKAADDIAKLPPILDGLHQSFKNDLERLIHATKPVDIAAYAKKVGGEVTKGVGNLATTNHVLETLRHKLDNTHDPKTQAILREQIKAVERKVVGREYVQRQINEAKKVAASSESIKQKTADLNVIQKNLLAHGDVHAANEVGKLITLNTTTSNLPPRIAGDLSAIMSGTENHAGKNSDDTGGRTPSGGSPTGSTPTTVNDRERADGGMTYPGRIYRINERRAEYFEPLVPTRVHSNAPGLMSASQARAVMVNLQVHLTAVMTPKVLFSTRSLQERQRADLRLGKVSAG